LVDMNAVGEMDDDDIEELAFTLWNQLTPQELVAEAEAVPPSAPPPRMRARGPAWTMRSAERAPRSPRR